MEHKTYHGRPVIWSPQPRQAAFMARTEDEALYGGAAGGGKSDALIIEALRQVHIPHYRALILRKTYPQLSELIDKTMRYYKPVFPKNPVQQQHTLLDLPQRGEDLLRQPEPHTGQVQLSGQSVRLYRCG